MSEETLKENKQSESSLENFEWNESGDWFGVPGESSEETAVLEKKPEEAEEVEEAEEPEKEEEPDNTEFFSEDEQTESAPADSTDLTDLALDLRDKGIMDFDLEEGQRIDSDTFFSLQENEIQRGVEEFTESFIEALQVDEDAAAFIRFKKEGGSTREFFNTYSKTSDIPYDADITEEDGQEQVAKYIIKNLENADEEDTLSRLEWLKDNGKLASFADKGIRKLKRLKESNEKQLIEAQKNQQRDMEERRRSFQKSLTDTIRQVDSVGDFSISANDRKSLPAYISEPSVKMGSGYVPEMHAAISNILSGKEPEKLILLAKLLKDDFKVEQIKQKAKTEYVKSPRLAVKQGGRPHSTSSASSRGKDLASRF